MRMPTEAGYYHWREGPEWSWRVRRVGPEAGSGPLLIGADCFGGPYDLEAEGGEWGLRIPEPPDFSQLPPGAKPQLIWVLCDPSDDPEDNEVLFGKGVRVIPAAAGDEGGKE